MQVVSVDSSYVPAQETESVSNRSLAFADLVGGLKNIRLWHYIAITEMRRRYRRTIIGPFWASLSIGIFIGCMGVVLSALWKSDPKTFLPYFSSGYICWMLMSSLVTEGCTTLIANETYLKQLSIPYVIYACLTTWRNFMVFAHHIIIYALVLIYCGHPLTLNTLYIIPGLFITFITGVFVCLLLGMMCARYRDIQQIISSLLQLAMFVTPIMWRPEQLGAKGQFITNLNPVYHYISIVRLPLMGGAPSHISWILTILGTIVLGWFTFELFTKKYRTLIYWL